MKACVLVAALPEIAGRVSASLPSFETFCVSGEARVDLLARIGDFQAVVVAHDMLRGRRQGELGDAPLVRLGPDPDPDTVRQNVEAAVRQGQAISQRRAGELERLSQLPYSAYLELVRFRATRRYLLGLMHRHRGSVTAASRAAGIARESLYRQLRRHDVHADAFRTCVSP